MTALVSYQCTDAVATITMDDGKVNVLSPQMLGELNAALDRAEAEGAVVVLTGREGRFSGGFDLGVLTSGGEAALDMLDSGWRLAERLLAFPRPVLIACNGHAIAMASFLLLSVDHRIGVRGPFRIMANEVAIGLVLPRAAIELCRARLTPSALQRALNLAEAFSPESAVAAGFLDEIVDPAELVQAAQAKAEQLAALDAHAHTATKRRLREPALAALRTAAAADHAELVSGGGDFGRPRSR